MEVRYLIFATMLFNINILKTLAKPNSITSILKEINLVDIVRIIQIPDTLKQRLISCVGKHRGVACPQPATPDTYKKLVEFATSKDPEAQFNEAPLESLLLTLLQKALKTFSYDILPTIKDIVVKIVSFPDKVTQVQAWLSGADKEANRLISIAGQIVTQTEEPNPYDPYQDISRYLKVKQAANIKTDLKAQATNRKELAKIFADSDPAITRKFGAKYNPIVPAALLYGFIKTFVHVL